MTLNRNTQLKSRKPLNRYSLRKIIELNGQVETRIELCKRAGGTPELKTRKIKFTNNTGIELHTVTCQNGFCEECGRFNALLSPHEDPPRSKGGKVSLEQSRMLGWNCCHRKKKGSPMWTKSGLEVNNG